MCIDLDDNELEVLEVIHHFVEILDRYFGSVCELDLIFNFHKAYYILDEILIAGELQETSKKTVARLIAAQEVGVATPDPIARQVRGLPFNRYSWLRTHKSFAKLGQRSGTGSRLLTLMNQQDSITPQLHNSVRGLMLDMYDFRNDIWLCHSFGGQCYNTTAFQPAINVLKEIQVFLENNTFEIITIFIEDYLASPIGLTKENFGSQCLGCQKMGVIGQPSMT
ncbi:PI-PLC X domain-containing protein [Drosera capensis]